jgi:hypothetical protein
MHLADTPVFTRHSAIFQYMSLASRPLTLVFARDVAIFQYILVTGRALDRFAHLSV